jgi:hypothetical protein
MTVTKLCNRFPRLWRYCFTVLKTKLESTIESKSIKNIKMACDLSRKTMPKFKNGHGNVSKLKDLL